MGDEADALWDAEMIEEGYERTSHEMDRQAAEAKVACPHCGKRLKGRDGVYTHIKAKHGGKGKAAFAPQREDSLADLYREGLLP